MKAAIATAAITVGNAAMPVCSTVKCPSMCTCVESKCGNLFDQCTADTQCDGIMNCMLGCSCGNIFCAMGCVSGKTLDTISASVKSCATSCASSDRTQLYDRKIVPATWHVSGRASSHQKMTFTLALKQQNLDKLDQEFWAVADPKSSKWREFKTVKQVADLVAPKAEHVATVQSWLELRLSQGAVVEHNGDAVKVRTTVKDLENLFSTELYTYTHDNGHTITRTLGEHSVPIDVFEAIDFVSGLSEFPMHRPSSRKVPKPDASTATAAVKPLVVPQTLIKMYSVPEKSTDSVSQSVAEFQDDASYNKADLQSFFNQTNLAAATVSDTVGPFDGTYPDTEATLDIQYIMSVGQKQADWYWTTPGWMYEWSTNFFNTKAVPDSVSISWGWAEDQQCSSGIGSSECTTLGIDASQYVARTNTEFQKIGLRGVSLFAASGDSGANGRTDGECTGTTLHASFPGSSPYITAVGATMLQDATFDLPSAPTAPCSAVTGAKCASGGTEVAVSVQVAGFTSGGGFSTYTPMPSYQKTAVEAYLKSGTALPPSSYFNSTNRGYPDVSAMGNNFMIYMDSYGGWSTVGGTSASSPSFAGVVAHLNDLSYKTSGKPLGFLNPFLYQMHADMPSAFTDVTIGDNKCTEDGCAASCKGYECAKGWDPVSGLGTPVASNMLKYLEQQLSSAVSI